MSKNSAKQMYTQLMEWLPTVKKTAIKSAPERTRSTFSKADSYKNTRA